MEESHTKTKALIGVFGAFILTIIALLPWGGSYADMFSLFIWSRLRICLATILIVLYSLKIERQPLLFSEREKNVSFTPVIKHVLILLLVIFIGAAILYFLMKMLRISTSDFTQILFIRFFNKNYALVFYTCIIAGFTEELIFRGYMLSRLKMVFSKNSWPVFISSLLFSILHFGYNSSYEFIATFLFGVLFSVYYLKYGNLRVLMITHFLYDYMVISYMMAYYK